MWSSIFNVNLSLEMKQFSLEIIFWTGLESVALCFIIFIGWRSFPGLFLKGEKKKKIKVKCSDSFPEKRPPYSLIGFMFFSCLMIDASLVHWHVSREYKSEGRMVLTLDIIWKDFVWSFQCVLFFCPLFTIFYWSRKALVFHSVDIFPESFSLSWNNLCS